MYTTAPEITIDTTVGQVVVASTATPTSAPSTSSAPSSTATPTPAPTGLFLATPIPQRRYRTDNALTIYGYGPINSVVTLRGFGVSEKTTSDETGLFRFNAIYSFTYSYPELCVQLVDSENRVTQPTCIPPLPNNSLIPLEVGPILLSPTLSLSGNRVSTGEQSILSGKTTPNTLVNIFIAKRDSKRLFALIPEANAYNLPILNTTSNERGEFDVNMPTSDIAEYNIFASTKFGENLSAKSNTLQFAVVSSTKSFFDELIRLILQNKIMIFIFLEVLIFIMLFVFALKRTTKPYKRHLESDYLKFIKDK